MYVKIRSVDTLRPQSRVENDKYKQLNDMVQKSSSREISSEQYTRTLGFKYQTRTEVWDYHLIFMNIFAGDNGLNVWLTEGFLFSLKLVIKFSLEWVTSCRSYVRFISLFCPVNSLKCLSAYITTIFIYFFDVFLCFQYKCTNILFNNCWLIDWC